jgi:predicted extracellular nuclease
MRKYLILLFILFPFLVNAQTSIYDIQFTTASVDGSYPSTKNGQTVNTGGIVTAINYLSGQFFISSSQGGAWNGLFVYDNNYSPAIGDSILITGYIAEYQGYTEIKDLASFSIKSSGNTLPAAVQISTNNVTSEAYEGVLVELSDCDVSSTYDSWGGYEVDDGSGKCEISTGIFKLEEYGFPLLSDYPFDQIIGVIGINSSTKKLHPRSIDDIKSASNEFVLFTEEKLVENTSSFYYPVKVGILNQSNSITNYSVKLQYDVSKFQYEGFNTTGTISETGTITEASTSGNIVLDFTGSISSDDISTLVNLNFTPTSEGEASLSFNSPTINGSIVNYTSAGVLEYGDGSCDIPIGDTLTVVQRPLLNIPSIVVPQQEMEIECFAPQTATDWSVELFYEDVTVPLAVNETTYDTDLAKWTLTVSIPDVDLYELYDMRVTASGGLSDEVVNAVKVIDQFKDDYYFVHITDLHLLGHTFYGETGYETDHTEIDDFNEVINDINLINPEFVLLTGDLINEGELEEFECLRNHTLTVELLEKLEVPVYIVPGNHDLGGWDATPPPQGTARQEWWRFFGWRQREIPPTKTEYLTHDYSFDYGNVHFTGLEAYDNYDSYMYDVYGEESFISSQITWLNNDLAAAGDKTKVLFYHFDFKNELNIDGPDSIGVDMALWGHNHNNTGDINSYPYNLSTAATCDGSRTYRVIRVNDGVLQAENSVQTHSSGDMLTINFNMLNDGSLDSVSATIQNNHSLSFNNGLVKFVMPISNFGYNVTNGRLVQVLEDGEIATCYVEVSITANGQITTSIEKISSLEITSIYDIQYTTEVGDGTYPSILSGQALSTAGIVTANNYSGGRYFISSQQGGAWNGILVYDNNYNPSIGDSVVITGTVAEYNGFTEMKDLTSLTVINSGNQLPNAVKVSANEVINEEYEGVFVEINNSNVSSVFDAYGNWSVHDGSGSCNICVGIYNLMSDGFTLLNNYAFESVKGVVAYYYGSTSIQPRFLEDIQANDDGFLIITDDKSVNNNFEFSYPVKISIIQSTKDISSYTLKVQYNSAVFKYEGHDKLNTISEVGSVSDNSSDGNIELVFTGATTLEKTDTLIKLNFSALSTGAANIQFSGTSFNSNDLLYSEIGILDADINITSIYDIQYTTDAGDGTHPSTLTGQTVNTGGIVTATGYLGNRFFISASQGGAWNGILVFDDNYTPSIGDSVLISGTVEEYNGYTDLKDLISLKVISSGNTLPNSVKISINEVSTEAFEGVLVEVNNSSVSAVFDEYGNWSANDGSGDCSIGQGIYSLMSDGFISIEDYNFESIKGVTAYYYGSMSILPRALSDFQAPDNGFIIITDDKSVDNDSEFSYPVKISIIQSTQDISSYTLKIQYNSSVFQYEEYDELNTISEVGSITDNSTKGNIELVFAGTTTLAKTDTLIKLNFSPISDGIANIQFSGTSFNGNDLAYSKTGILESTYSMTSIYDIQHTTVAGDGTYPSLLNGQTVTTGGIVTAINYMGGRFFISSSKGGVWNGILVYDESYSPAIGDSVLLVGKVTEYSGYTELTGLTSLQIVSSSNTLPEVVAISTSNVNNEEYEGAFVEITNSSVSAGFDDYGNFSVDDGGGSCDIRSGIYNLKNDGFLLLNNYSFNKIKGVVGINSGHNTIHPRLLSDIEAADNGFIILTEDKSVADNSEIDYPIKISIIQASNEVTAYSLQVQYDSEVFQYNGYDKESTVSESGSISDVSAEGNIELNYTGTTNIEKTDTLIRLSFTPLSVGSATIQLSGTNINSNDLAYSIIGSLESTYSNTTQVDQVNTKSSFKHYPNPFSEEMSMEYEIQQKAKINISVYNMAGQLIKILVNENKAAGGYCVKWNASDFNENRVQEGIYIYKYMVDGKQISSGQLLFIK